VTFRHRAPLQGSGPYSACGVGERHTPGSPSPVTLRLQGLYPLDALFPPKPPAVFQTVTLLGFALRRIPLPRHGSDLSAHPARMALAQTDPPTRAVQILARLPGIALRGSPLSPASRRSGRTRASLGLCSPSRGTLSPRRPRARRGLPPSGLADSGASTEPVTGPSECRSRRASKFSEENLSPSWGSCTSSRRTGCRCRTGLNDPREYGTPAAGEGQRKPRGACQFPLFPANSRSRGHLPLLRSRTERSSLHNPWSRRALPEFSCCGERGGDRGDAVDKKASPFDPDRNLGRARPWFSASSTRGAKRAAGTRGCA